MNRMKVGGGYRLVIETPCEIGDRIWTVENGNVMRCMCQGVQSKGRRSCRSIGAV